MYDFLVDGFGNQRWMEQRRKHRKLIDQGQPDQRACIADYRGRLDQDENSWLSDSSMSATGTPERPARRRKSTRFIVHTPAARLEERRPSSKSLSASKNFASLTNSSCDCPDPRST